MILYDKDDFLNLYLPCNDRLGRFIATMVWDREEARDLASETLLVAMENFHRLNDKKAFLGFLFGIAIRLVRKHEQKNRRNLLFDDTGWSMLHEKSQMENSSDAMDLRKLLDLLNHKSREALVLFEIGGFSIKEISEIQGSSVPAVKSRLCRARETLQEACKKETKPVYFKAG